MRNGNAGHEVVIAGGGPTGLMLAGELAIAGIDVVIVERRERQELTGARAAGLHARTLEVLDQRGIVDRFLSEGTAAQVAGFAWIPLDISDFPTRFNHGLALWQNDIERLLGAWVDELDVAILRGCEVIAFTQHEDHVDVALADGSTLRAAWLVGCDGGRSTVRRHAGIDFAGWDPTVSHLIAEVEAAEEPTWGLRRDELGIHGLSRMGDGGAVRVLTTERAPGRTEPPTFEELREALVSVHGTDFGVHTPRWISSFNDAARQATTYRKDRVLLAGDAAHVHYPAGGQGLNLGLQDAVNLGWKLARVARGTAPEALLDSYHAERHPVGAAVLRNTLAQVALLRADARSEALRAIFTELLSMDGPRRRIAAMISGLDVHYDLGEGHPLLGRRMPDRALETDQGPTRVSALLHEARPVLLDLGGPGGPLQEAQGAAGFGELRTVRGHSPGPWELPVVGGVTAPDAVLIRPDGHVAWVGEGTTEGLGEALRRWVGGTPRDR